MNQKSGLRYPMVDFIRGLAVLLMIIFHFFYDLRIFGFNKISFTKDPFWWTFPRVIVFLFLTAMGLALPLAHKKSINWPKFWPRFLKITVCAVGISGVTYFLFKDRWIYFGTLHCIALCSIATLPLLRFPKLALILGLILLIPQVFLGFKWWWWSFPHHSMDYIPFLPWWGVVLMGVFYNSIGLHKMAIPQNKILSPIYWMGKHSLIIYLVHQPVLYGSVYLFYKLSR